MEEKRIRVAAFLYEMRDSARSLAKIKGMDYHEMLNQYTKIVHKVMSDRKIGAIDALLVISEMEVYKQNGMVHPLFIAAAVEIEEPSKPE